MGGTAVHRVQYNRQGIVGEVSCIPGFGAGAGAGEGGTGRDGVGEALGWFDLPLSFFPKNLFQNVDWVGRGTAPGDAFGEMCKIIKYRSRTSTWWGRRSRSGRRILELVRKYEDGI